MQNMKNKRIIASILNWNGSEMTAACVESLFNLDNTGNNEIEIIVIDNGSRVSEWELLKLKLAHRNVRLLRQEKNLGFAGGHNLALRIALAENSDFVWLVNSDAVVKAGSLDKLVERMNSDSQCGAVSPLILGLQNEKEIDFCGARHDWQHLDSVTCRSISEAQAMEVAYPSDMWLMGAAILLRVNAIRQIGLLDDKLFAYYEDNDICARLSAAGWLSKMVFDAVVLHSHPTSRMHEKPPYYFYLMARNSFRFWFQHTPKQYRRLIRLKLIDRSILVANRLHSQGLEEKVAACLLGISDGQTGKTGKWNLHRSPPLLVRVLRKILWRNHSKHLQSKSV